MRQRLFLIELQALACEFYGIFKNTFFKEHLWATVNAFKLRVFAQNIRST